MASESWYGIEEHRIRIAEVDSTGTMSFHALLNLMQEVAWNNSEELGYSVYHLMEKGLSWVVNRMQFTVKRYPRHYERVIVKSWPSGVDRLFTYRDYQVFDTNGEMMVSGTSSWLILDIEKRKPAAIKGNFDLVFPKDVPRVALDKTKIGVVDSANSTSRIVGYTDTDANQHTTNARYIEWALAHFYGQQQGIVKPFYVDMQFKGESVIGEKLIISSGYEAVNEALISIQNQTRANTTFLCRIKTGMDQ
ncbi:MAG: acyl-ACP thioesterase domain-containing protein [Bacteroidota bacterium]